MEIFPGGQGQVNSQHGNRPGRNSNSIGTLWVSSLPARKNEEDSIKNEGNRVATSSYVIFFRSSRADNSDLAEIQTHSSIYTIFMSLILRIKTLLSKVKSLEWLQHFAYYKSMGIYFRSLRAGKSTYYFVFA